MIVTRRSYIILSFNAGRVVFSPMRATARLFGYWHAFSANLNFIQRPHAVIFNVNFASFLSAISTVMTGLPRSWNCADSLLRNVLITRCSICNVSHSDIGLRSAFSCRERSYVAQLSLSSPCQFFFTPGNGDPLFRCAPASRSSFCVSK